VRNFSPDLIIVSSGFDAAKGDLIGDCLITPEAYYLMTSSLLTLNKNTPIVVAMEGGYNLEVIPLCMEAVVMAMRGESWDEDGTENPLAALSSPQPKHKSRISLSTDPLVRARLELNKYWDYYEENSRTRGKKLATGAVASINKVVEVIIEGRAFGDVRVRKVREQIPKREGALGGRGKKKEGRQDYLGAAGMDSLMSAMSAVKIGK
jgi:histone deacetylase 6